MNINQRNHRRKKPKAVLKSAFQAGLNDTKISSLTVRVADEEWLSGSVFDLERNGPGFDTPTNHHPKSFKTTTYSLSGIRDGIL